MYERHGKEALLPEVYSPASMARISMGDIMEQKTKITNNIQKTKEYMKDKLQIPRHFGLVFREFQIRFRDGWVDAFLCYFDGMSDTTFINRDILRNLLQNGVPESLSVPREKTILEKRYPVIY